MVFIAKKNYMFRPIATIFRFPLSVCAIMDSLSLSFVLMLLIVFASGCVLCVEGCLIVGCLCVQRLVSCIPHGLRRGGGVLLQFLLLRPSSVSSFLANCVNCIWVLSVVRLILVPRTKPRK